MDNRPFAASAAAEDTELGASVTSEIDGHDAKSDVSDGRSPAGVERLRHTKQPFGEANVQELGNRLPQRGLSADRKQKRIELIHATMGSFSQGLSPARSGNSYVLPRDEERSLRGFLQT